MGFAEQEHQGAGLADATTDREWKFIVDDALVIGELEIVEKVGYLKLAAQGFCVDADAHRSEFVAALGDVVPDQDVAVESMSVAQGLLARVGDPVVIIGGAILMREAVFQRPADADNKDGRILLEDDGLAAFAREIGVHREEFFGVEEGEFFGKIGIARLAQFGDHFLGELLGSDENFPNLAHDGFQKLDIALLGGDDALPVPLVDVGGVVVIEK